MTVAAVDVTKELARIARRAARSQVELQRDCGDQLRQQDDGSDFLTCRQRCWDYHEKTIQLMITPHKVIWTLFKKNFIHPPQFANLSLTTVFHNQLLIKKDKETNLVSCT